MTRLKTVYLTAGTWMLLLLLIQCRKEESVLAPNVAKLVGNWQLIEPNSLYTVTLNITLDTLNPPHDVTPFLVTGESSVNAYNGRLFAVLDGTISADNLGSTYVAGSPQASQFEQTYFNALKTVARFELTTDVQLRLFHGGQQPGTLVYKRIK